MFNTLLKISASIILSCFVLASCGPESTDSNDSNDGTSGTGNAGSTSNTYCDENYPSSTSTFGNVYVFDVTSPDCIGVQETVTLKKSIPWDIDVIDIDSSLVASPQFNYESNLKIALRKSGFNPIGYDLYGSLSFTNNSAFDYCYTADNIELKDSDDTIISLTTSFDDVPSGALINTSSDTRRRCLLAGETHTYIADASGVSENTFNSIASATLPEIELDELRNRFSVAPDISAELKWLNPGNGSLGIPTLSVTWTNTTSDTIRIDDNAQKVWFMDDDGYVLSESYVYLDQFLGIDETELTPSDFLIVSGGTITLEDTDADNAYSGLSPSSATRVLVYLDWEIE